MCVWGGGGGGVEETEVVFREERCPRTTFTIFAVLMSTHNVNYRTER